MTAIQQFHSRRHSLKTIELHRFEVMDFFADMTAQASSEKRIPKYSIIVFDYTTSATR